LEIYLNFIDKFIMYRITHKKGKINAKIKILFELTEHTIANEIEAPKEVLRKEFQ